MTENTQNTVPFEYTLRPRSDQPAYTPVVGEPWNPPPVATYLHLQVQLPFEVNRNYGVAVDWPTDAGMRPSADKVISLASYKTYSAGTLELDEDGVLWAHYVAENSETSYTTMLTGEPAEYIKTALVKLFAHDYTAQAVQLEDDDESDAIGDNNFEKQSDVTWPSVGDSDDDEGDEDDEYED